MARGVAHSPEVKAAVLAALLAGQSITKVAEEYKINKSTVISWRDSSNLGQTEVEPQKRKALDEVLFDLIYENLQTLTKQVRFFGNEEWLREQNAADLAVLHGVQSDKTFRLLGALRPEADESPASETPEGNIPSGGAEQVTGGASADPSSEDQSQADEPPLHAP